MPPPLPREYIFKLQRAPETAVSKAADHLLNPPQPHPHPLAWHTLARAPPPPPPLAFYVVDSTTRPLQTTINMSASDDRVGPGMFRINWPQLQLIRSPKLEPCSLGSVNVITGESGASGGSCCTSSGRKNMHLHQCTQHHWESKGLALTTFILPDDNNLHTHSFCEHSCQWDVHRSVHSWGYLFLNGQSTHLKYFYESAV